MTRIGLLSDTHGTIDERILAFFGECDEVWHAGDIGTVAVADRLVAFRKFRAVYGNIDDNVVRSIYPEIVKFRCEDLDVLMTHIGGYPGHYDARIRQVLYSEPPHLFIAGHSHILRVIYDKKLGFLHMNPGAAGNSGFHRVKTAIRFTVDGRDIKNLEIWEAARS